jgi:hypothetical protein
LVPQAILLFTDLRLHVFLLSRVPTCVNTSASHPNQVQKMHVTDLALNKAMGMLLAPAGQLQAQTHVLEMPESPLLLNHLGTIHASAQFALAEAGSGEFLIAHVGNLQPPVFAVLRTSEVKFRKPAHGTLHASAKFKDGDGESLASELKSRRRALVSVLVEVADLNGVITMSGQYDWFLQSQPPPESVIT